MRSLLVFTSKGILIMKLYLLYNDIISSVKYSKVTEDSTEPSSVPLVINNDNTGIYVDVPDLLLNDTLNIIVNDTFTIPVMLSNSTWLDEVDVNAYVEDNSYIAKVNKHASEYVRYKDLYKILHHYTSGTIDRIHEILGY